MGGLPQVNMMEQMVNMMASMGMPMPPKNPEVLRSKATRQLCVWRGPRRLRSPRLPQTRLANAWRHTFSPRRPSPFLSAHPPAVGPVLCRDFLFSPDNLAQDTFFRQFMDEEGYVPHALLAQILQNYLCVGRSLWGC